MRILVLGGGRFQGRRAAELLREQHHDVVVFNRRSPVPGLPFIAGDRHDYALLGSILQRSFDVVIDNLAYQAADIADLLPLLTGHVGHYLFISSFVVYLPATAYTPVDEEQADLTSRAGGAYDIGKRDCEALLRAHPDAVPWTALRFANIEGPHDPSSRRGFFIDRIRDGGGILLPSDALSPYQPLWRDDAARAAVQVAGHTEAHYRAFNVAGSEVYTVSEWLHLVAQIMGCPPPEIVAWPSLPLQRLVGFDYRLPLPMRPLLDTTSLRHVTGFRPTAAREWLPDTIRWWETSGLASRFWEHRARERAAVQRLLHSSA